MLELGLGLGLGPKEGGALCGAMGSRCLPESLYLVRVRVRVGIRVRVRVKESLYRRMWTMTSSPALRLKPTTEPRSCSV